MSPENIRRVLDAFYMAKRIRDMLPPLPQGVPESYIRFLDTVQHLQAQNAQVRISDVSDALHLQRPGVTRTIKEMQARGYIQKIASDDDGRVTYISVTEAGAKLSEKYNRGVFDQLSSYLPDISDEEADVLVRTTQKIYDMMSTGRVKVDEC